jgi:hypothetical protein
MPRWERWLPAGESLKKRQLAGKMPALPGGFAEVSFCVSSAPELWFNWF